MTRSLCIILAALLLTSAVMGQGLATIVGTVTDPSGAVVPGAEVTATEVGTGYARTAKTNPEGYYVIPSLRPAEFAISVQAAGFRMHRQSGITLLTNQSLTVNVALELGSPTESVKVEGAASLVDTTTGTIRQVVDQARMVELPLNGRNAAELTLLVPGVVRAPAQDADQGLTKTFPGAVTISSSGSRQNQVGYLLDGGNFNDLYTNVNMPFPFPDALQEFSVQTSNYSADYGQRGGGIVNVVTKSGTNELHGSGFGFLRNKVFNARNFFAADRDELKRFQFGGTVGGPVVVPGAYNGRERSFFFFGYQGTRIRNVRRGVSAFVPTPASLNGDFSALLNASHPDNPLRRVIQIRDPVTGQFFPGNVIPTSRFDPASLGALRYVPAAGGSGAMFFDRPLRQDFDETITRIDHSFSDSDRLTFRWTDNVFENAGMFDGINLLNTQDRAWIRAQNYLLHETHIFSPSLLNEFRFTYGRELADRGPAAGVPSVADFGVKNIFQPPVKVIQSVSVSGFFSFAMNSPAKFPRNDFAWSDDLRWVKGAHSLALGAYVERARVDVDNLFRQPGMFSFTGDITGYALADFLLGKVRRLQQGFGEFYDGRNTMLGFYIHDNLRMSGRLTLSLGLRYEPTLPWRELRNRKMQFRPDAFAKGLKSRVYVNAPPGLFFPGDADMPEHGTTRDLNNLSPRVGFAYDLSGNARTSLRGGMGIFLESHESGFSPLIFADESPFSPQLNILNPPGPFSDPLRGVPNPFPAPFPPPSDSVFPAPVHVSTYDAYSKLVTPVIYNWNLTLEHQLPGQWFVRAAYVGSHGSHLKLAVNLNPAVYSPGSSLGPDARRLFGGFSDIFMDSRAANSSYNSVQLSAERRLGRLTMVVNYTGSKALDDLQPSAAVAVINSGTVARVLPWYFANGAMMDRGPSAYDRTHVLVSSYVWRLPSLSKAQRWVSSLVGGWEATGVLTAQSGSPLTIAAGRDQSQTALGQDRAVLLGQPYGLGACGNRAPCVDYLTPAAFSLPPAGTFGTLGKGRLRARNFFNWDMGFFKSFALTERWKLQFRAEFFNIFNRMNPGNPVSNMSSAGFGSITSASDPRIGQFALKVSF